MLYNLRVVFEVDKTRQVLALFDTLGVEKEERWFTSKVSKMLLLGIFITNHHVLDVGSNSRLKNIKNYLNIYETYIKSLHAVEEYIYKRLWLLLQCTYTFISFIITFLLTSIQTWSPPFLEQI